MNIFINTLQKKSDPTKKSYVFINKRLVEAGNDDELVGV
jgi:hypothetical protein